LFCRGRRIEFCLRRGEAAS